MPFYFYVLQCKLLQARQEMAPFGIVSAGRDILQLLIRIEMKSHRMCIQASQSPTTLRVTSQKASASVRKQCSGREDLNLSHHRGKSMTIERFHWTVFDVRSLLPHDWQEQIIYIAKHYARTKVLVTQHSTSREAQNDFRLPVQSVGGDDIRDRLPWLRSLYEGEFLRLAQLTTIEPVSLMSDSQFAVVLNVQTGH